MNLRISGILAFSSFLMVWITVFFIPIHKNTLAIYIPGVFSLFFIGFILYLSKFFNKRFLYLAFVISISHIMTMMVFFSSVGNFPPKGKLNFLLIYLLLTFSLFGLGISLWLFLKRLYLITRINSFKVASISFLVSGMVYFIPIITALFVSMLLYISGGYKGAGSVVVLGFMYSFIFSTIVLKIVFLIGSISSIVGFFKIKGDETTK